MSTLKWFVPLLIFSSYSSKAQVTGESPAPTVDSVCLSEILINTTQPYDPAQIAAAQRKADTAREAIRQGAKFEDIAKKYSDGPSAALGGALGLFKRGQLAKSIEDKVFVMKVGDVSDVIRTKQGFAILKVAECYTVTGVGGASRTVEILSDTRGVDFGPYVRNVEKVVKNHWYHLIPLAAETKNGKLAVDFAIMKDGRVQGLVVRASSGDRELDRPAYGSIVASDPFPPLPDEFTGPYLQLRFRFYYNPDKPDLR